MKTERIEIEHAKKINLEQLAIDAKDVLGIELVIQRKPQTQTVVTDEGEVIDYLGYAFEVPEEAAADFAALIEQHAPERDDAEEAQRKEKTKRKESFVEQFREALEDPEFIKLLKGALGNDKR
jgi:NACalpha-BTF3-like transcription factor